MQNTVLDRAVIKKEIDAIKHTHARDKAACESATNNKRRPVSFKASIHSSHKDERGTPILIAETADLDHLPIKREYRRFLSFSTQFT